VRLGVEEGFRINVDMIFGMPGEDRADVEASLGLARELAGLGGAHPRAHVHAVAGHAVAGSAARRRRPGDDQ
jgi:radical SAM superfamily enzyme YgiQ (UPF0313 family)